MKKIIINEYPWQTRIATTVEDTLQNVYFASHATQTLERSFFKGIVTKVLPGTQSAFVDIGQKKAGYLHISEVDRELAIQKISGTTQLEEDEQSPRRSRGSQQERDIKKIFSEGESVLVQVSKEPIYDKGAKLTTCFTLPGRFIVLMPNIPRIAISKKIASKQERQRLREVVGEQLPEGMGAIIRTTSEDRSAPDLAKDIAYLVKSWETIQSRFQAAKTVEKIYEDMELSLQVIRDSLDDDVEAIVVDNKETQSKIYKFIKMVAPEHSHKVTLYTGTTNIFDHFGITKQINDALEKRASLVSGGSLIIESAEAMTVVDVNTGRFIGKGNLEETILKTNLEAAKEIVRQLRLRNIGGLIVIDFIDMASPANRQKLFNVFEKSLREQDKFQSVVLKVSEFGLVQMTRKRSGKTLVQELTNDCSTCKGSGFVKSLQTQCYVILRDLNANFKSLKGARGLKLQVSVPMFNYVTSNEYNAILQLEKLCACKIEVVSNDTFEPGYYKIEKK